MISPLPEVRILIWLPSEILTTEYKIEENGIIQHQNLEKSLLLK
jgi:hypothetical protein